MWVYSTKDRFFGAHKNVVSICSPREFFPYLIKMKEYILNHRVFRDPCGCWNSNFIFSEGIKHITEINMVDK